MSEKFYIAIEKEELSTGEPVYVAHCPKLGVSSQGKDTDEAKNNIKEAIELYLEEHPDEKGSEPMFSVVEVDKSAKT